MPELEELYSDIKDKLYSYIMKLSGDSHVAEEIVQETFCRALEHILIDKKNLNTSWFYTVAKHLYFNYVKERCRYKYTDDFDKVDEDIESNPLNNLMQSDEITVINSILSQLQNNYRKVIELREFKELSYDEIAKETGMTLVQVKVTLYRARKKFKELYKCKIK